MGQPYSMLLGARDWQPLLDGGGEDVVWDMERQQLTLAPELIRFPRRETEKILNRDDRRGAAADAFGHIYWIADDGRSVRYRPAGSSGSAELWSVADFDDDCAAQRSGLFQPKENRVSAVPQLRGLTVTSRSYLVVGTLQPGGLLIFDLHNSGPPRWHAWPQQVDFAPFDLAATGCGGTWILDLPNAGDATLWYLDASLRIGVPPGSPQAEIEASAADHFGIKGGDVRVKPAATHPLAMPLLLTVPAVETMPVAIEVMPDGTLLLLDQGPAGAAAYVHRLRCGVSAGPRVDLTDTIRKVLPQEPEFRGHDFAFLQGEPDSEVPGAVAGTLFVAQAEGNQSFAFSLQAIADELTIDASTQYYPMRRYAGKALVSAPCDVYYDQTEIWLPLTRLPRPRYAREGTIDGLVFDSRMPRCDWHRLFFDGCIPPGDKVVIESRSADDVDELKRTGWQTEQRPYLRQAHRRELPSAQPNKATLIDEGERPFHRPFGGDSLAHKGVGTWELLFQQVHGRYVEIRLTLVGSGRSTPKLRSLRLQYPRLSYPKRFLPAVYREDPVSASFVERFLANFEGTYTETEDRIASVESFFDSRTAPPEALDWLASWLGAALSDDWEVSRRRLFIRHAMDLYRQRGTIQGLVRAIRVATEPCPDERIFDAALDHAPFGIRIVEGFSSRYLPGDRETGTATSLLSLRTAANTAWQPAQGQGRLNRLWRDFLQRRHTESDDSAELLTELAGIWTDAPARIGDLRFWALTPADEAHAADRRAFIDEWMGLPYADLDAGDTELFRSYLRRKYRSVDALNTAYALTGSSRYVSFDAIDLPPEDRLPADGAPLADWIQFATVDVAATRSAHRFTVLVPVDPSAGPEEQQQLLARVAAVVERERPSHAQFDVQLYWALFRVGTARTGLDTLVGEGSRFTSLVLGSGFIGEGLLDEAHPWHVTDRWVSGRDAAAVIG